MNRVDNLSNEKLGSFLTPASGNVRERKVLKSHYPVALSFGVRKYAISGATSISIGVMPLASCFRG
jgi:hypothetical protein